ncbi:hypothetical protein ACSBR1_022144 [Camellia fascicularis]
MSITDADVVVHTAGPFQQAERCTVLNLATYTLVYYFRFSYYTAGTGGAGPTMNLSEVKSAHEVLRVPTVSARFGTAPFFWNWGMEVMTNFLPGEFLRDRIKVQNLVEQFDPVVRVVDGIAGESVGTATAAFAFALAILEGSTQPGVWFPEEPEGIAIEAREALLKRAAQGTINFVMNKFNL